ncbi:MAG: 2-polyprenyl-3-methyl-5-hydroxy-6-metoxy-1,4-benzoquinol methylase [Verrucomicrobia bacterium]|nr:MAG: 2-polyprenyl-3-methyl-5-hydroxy-6-metoxy-1,4-benzoquinol methylase [Verrucomicrobiota bacterium]
MKVVQSTDGFVQLAHQLPTSIYARYGFAGGHSAGYRDYLTGFAARLRTTLVPDASIFEIGCGDGTLLDALMDVGFRDCAGMDPSPQADLPAPGRFPRYRGYFPGDLPSHLASRRYDAILCRHVLEHIEEPDAFLSAVLPCLQENGEFWIEVPDLRSTVERRWWTNFYAIHCNYFEAPTLDALLARHGMRCVHGETVPIFGGSLLRRYIRGPASLEPASSWDSIPDAVASWRAAMDAAVLTLPARTWGWGAAERTAAALAFSPVLESRLAGVVDGNRGLQGRWMAGTSLVVAAPESLAAQRPEAVVVFALSYAEPILEALRGMLPAGIPVLVPGDPVRHLIL